MPPKRVWDNAHYFGIIKRYIKELYFEPSRKEALAELCKELTVKSRKRFVQCGGYIKAQRIASIIENNARQQYGNGKSQTQEERDAHYKAMEGGRKIEEWWNNELESIDRLEFLRFAAEFASTLAFVQSRIDLNSRKNLYIAWRAELKALSPRLRRMNKQQQSKESLAILFGDDMEAIAKQMEADDEVNIFGHRTHARTWVNLDNELDLSRLTRGDYDIETLEDEGMDCKIILENEPSIHIRIDGVDQEISLLEYFEKKFKDEEKINMLPRDFLKSKDLLDNILIVYIIKMAQGGNEKAYNFLFDRYKQKAHKVALSFIRGKSLALKGREAALSGVFEEKNVTAVSETILKILLSGDIPSLVIRELARGKDRPDVSMMLNRWLHHIINQSYQLAFVSLEAHIEIMKANDAKFRKDLKNIKHRTKIAKSEKSRRHYLEATFSLGMQQIWSTDIQAGLSMASIRPSAMVALSSYFNSGVYKPNKQSNLTSWLFGSEEFKGVFLQKLGDWYKSQTYTVGKKRRVKTDDFGISKSVDEKRLPSESVDEERLPDGYISDIEKCIDRKMEGFS